MRVYKFLPRQFGLEAIANRRLKISEIFKANDVYEYGAVTPCLDGKLLSYDQIQEVGPELAKVAGILSFCEDASCPVVWGHYGECHRGLCLAFDVEERPVPPRQRSPLTKVTYLEKPTDFVIRTAEDQIKSDLITYFASSVKDGLFKKYSLWSYEREWRIVLPLTTKIGDLYFTSFDDDFVLKEIIVGCRNADSKADIAALLRQFGHSGVDVWKVKPMKEEFRMTRDTTFDVETPSS